MYELLSRKPLESVILLSIDFSFRAKILSAPLPLSHVTHLEGLRNLQPHIGCAHVAGMISISCDRDYVLTNCGRAMINMLRQYTSQLKGTKKRQQNMVGPTATLLSQKMAHVWSLTYMEAGQDNTGIPRRHKGR